MLKKIHFLASTLTSHQESTSKFYFVQGDHMLILDMECGTIISCIYGENSYSVSNTQIYKGYAIPTIILGNKFFKIYIEVERVKEFL